MEIDKCLELFEISDPDTIDKIKLKKIYHKLCLKHHPDKNKNNDSYKFIEIQNAYITLNQYYDNKIYSTNKNDKMNNDDKIYSFLISLFNKNNLEKLCNYMDKFIEKYNATTINYIIELEQLFNKSLFYNDDYGIYIPLWHKCIELNSIYEFLEKDKINKEILFITKLNNLPENIKIINNNNILIYVNRCELNKNIFSYEICKSKTIEFKITNTIKNSKYYVCLNEGIPTINQNNIYDCSILSHIIVCFIS